MFNVYDNKQVEEFITKIFNYYNGRINIINPARLEISYVRDDVNVGGHSKMPNVVVVYVNNIRNKTTDELNFKYLMVNIIIHELFHTDQLLYYSLYGNRDYYDEVEGAVEFMVEQYIANHMNEIAGLLNANVNNSYAMNPNLYKYAGRYIRRTFMDHVFILIDSLKAFDIESTKRISNKIMNYHKNNYNIRLQINDIVIDDIIHTNINVLNDIVYNAYFKYNCRHCMCETETDRCKRIYTIKIYTKNDYYYMAYRRK